MKILPVREHSETSYCPHCGEEFGLESYAENQRYLQLEADKQAVRDKKSGIANLLRTFTLKSSFEDDADLIIKKILEE